MDKVRMNSKLLLFVVVISAISSIETIFAEEDFKLDYDVFSNDLIILVDDKLVFLTPDKSNVGSNDNLNTISVMDTKTGSLLYTIEPPLGDAGVERFYRDIGSVGNNIVAVSTFPEFDIDKRITLVHVFDGKTGELLYTIDNPVLESMYLRYSLESIGNNLAVFASDEDPNDDKNGDGVHVFDGENGSLLYTIENPNPAMIRVFGSNLATINDNLLVHVTDRGHYRDNIPEIIYAFEGETGKLLYTIEYPKQTTPIDKSYGRSVVISGNNIVVRSDNVVFIYDGDTGKLRHTVNHPVTTNSELEMILNSIDDDAPFFVIFVYLDELFSWIVKNFENEQEQFSRTTDDTVTPEHETLTDIVTSFYDPIVKCEEQNGWWGRGACHLPDDTEIDYDPDNTARVGNRVSDENNEHILYSQIKELGIRIDKMSGGNANGYNSITIEIQEYLDNEQKIKEIIGKEFSVTFGEQAVLEWNEYTSKKYISDELKE